jgi:hypothetical protein
MMIDRKLEETMNYKKHLLHWPHGSAEHVIAHALRQRDRGRQPSESYKGIRNPKKALDAALYDLALQLHGDRIILLEDDYLQSGWIVPVLKKGTSRAVQLAETESEFYSLLPSMVKNPPALIILDVLVRWNNFRDTDPPIPEKVQKEGFYFAGFRCRDLVKSFPELRDVPIMFYTALESIDVRPYLQESDHYLRKSPDARELAKTVLGLLKEDARGATA